MSSPKSMQFPRIHVLCVLMGFIFGLVTNFYEHDLRDTADASIFVAAQFSRPVIAAVKWATEAKYTGQEDLPPGFRGEAPTTQARQRDGSQPEQCMMVDPSALVCSTVRVSGFRFLANEKVVMHRRGYDEIQGRSPFVSEDNAWIAFWCAQTLTWHFARAASEGAARAGSCHEALAVSHFGVQFKDSKDWSERTSTPIASSELQAMATATATPTGLLPTGSPPRHAHAHAHAHQNSPPGPGSWEPRQILMEVEMGDDWAPGDDIACR